MRKFFGSPTFFLKQKHQQYVFKNKFIYWPLFYPQANEENKNTEKEHVQARKWDNVLRVDSLVVAMDTHKENGGV